MQWFTTVGVPGGEYAVKADRATAAMWLILDCFDEFEITTNKDFGPEERERYEVGPLTIRPAPPELAEWLEAEMHKSSKAETEKGQLGTNTRTKVPGGWFYAGGAGESAAAVFVPVALASGITVIKDGE